MTGAFKQRRSIERILQISIGLLVFVFFVELIFFNLTPGNIDAEETLSLSENFSNEDDNVSPPLESFDELVNRSLFAWNRKPVTVASGSVEADATDIEEWELSGVVSHPDRAKLAIFAMEDSDRSLVLEEGMLLGDWEVTAIEGETVTLVEGEREKIMQLQTQDEESTKRHSNTRKQDSEKKPSSEVNNASSKTTIEKAKTIDQLILHKKKAES